jgi:hypothetical protein
MMQYRSEITEWHQALTPNCGRAPHIPPRSGGIGRFRDEASHPAAFVGFEVRDDDMAGRDGSSTWVNRRANVSVHRKGAGANERRLVVLDQKSSFGEGPGVVTISRTHGWQLQGPHTFLDRLLSVSGH